MQSTSENAAANNARPAKRSGFNVYKDEWAIVRPNELEITWFYFPSSASKFINTADIQGVYYRKQVLSRDIWLVKSWGMSFSPCWWACDVGRDMRGDSDPLGFYNVVIDCGEKTYKGFTNANIHAFLAALRPYCRPGTPFINDLPFGKSGTSSEKKTPLS